MRIRDLPLPFALVLLPVLSACSGGGGGGDDGPGRIRGQISVLPPSSVVLEQEPNDSAAQANDLGALLAGETLTILGQITDDGSDEFDAFLLDAPALIEVTATLDFDPSNDFDLLVFDPVSMSIVYSFQTMNVPEVGVFDVQGPFVLLVDSFLGSGHYALELAAVPADAAPAMAGGGSRWIGSLEPGQQLALRGEGAAGWRVTLPLGAQLEVRSEGAEVELLDATRDPLAPRPARQARSEAGAASAAFAPRSVALVRVRGEGPWSVEVAASPLAQPLPPAAPAPVALEARARRDAGARAFGEALPAVPGELLVRASGSGAQLPAALAAVDAAELDRIPGGALRVRVPLPEGLGGQEALRATLAARAVLATRPGVAWCEPNLYWQAQQVPNDPHYGLQWHYTQIFLPSAWDIATGDPDVLVAVVDTGSTDHPDLDERFVGGYDFISDPANAGDGDGRDPDPTDVGDGNAVHPSSFHGSHVAGTVGAETNNGMGVAGVTWQTGIMPLRVLGKLGGTNFDIANAILYAAGLPNVSNQVPPDPARVINMSLGGPGSSQTVQDAITNARAQGAVLFAAAGNSNSSAPFYPAAANGVVSVSAVGFDGKKAPYSNFHASVDLAAPGGNVTVDLNGDGYGDGVLSARLDDTTLPAKAVYAFEQGTSMASPHAAGVAALLLDVDPTLMPAQIEMLLQSTATDLGAAGKDPIFGHGLVNAFAALQAASGGGVGPPVLSLSTDALFFGPSQDQLSAQIANVGGGVLMVGQPVTSTVSGGSWLTATLMPSTAPDKDASAVQVTVDRGGLAPDTYLGSVQVPSNGGSASLQVVLQVQVGGGLPDVEIFVLAVDAQTLATEAQAVVNPALTPLTYSLPGLPPGAYLVVAGSDDDDDGFICGEGDLYCGIWPSFVAPEIVDVDEGETISDLDFPVSADFNSSLGAGGRGYALLPRE